MHAYYLFGKTPLPKELNTEIVEALGQLKACHDKETYLRQAYDVITHRYQASRFKTLVRLVDLFSEGVNDIWNRTGFLHCTNQNYLLTLLLVKGGLFSEKDITPKWTRIWLFSPHQYLSVRLSPSRSINVDCWARHYGVPYGTYARGFNSSRLKSFAE